MEGMHAMDAGTHGERTNTGGNNPPVQAKVPNEGTPFEPADSAEVEEEQDDQDEDDFDDDEDDLEDSDLDDDESEEFDH